MDYCFDLMLWNRGVMDSLSSSCGTFFVFPARRRCAWLLVMMEYRFNDIRKDIRRAAELSDGALSILRPFYGARKNFLQLIFYSSFLLCMV